MVEMELCNPMPFSTSFQKFQIGSFYNAKNIGTYEIESTIQLNHNHQL